MSWRLALNGEDGEKEDLGLPQVRVVQRTHAISSARAHFWTDVCCQLTPRIYGSSEAGRRDGQEDLHNPQ